MPAGWGVGNAIAGAVRYRHLTELLTENSLDGCLNAIQKSSHCPPIWVASVIGRIIGRTGPGSKTEQGLAS